MTDPVKLVRSFAWKACTKCPGILYADAQQEMLIVLMQARREYRTGTGLSFDRYLQKRLRWRYRTMVRNHVRAYKLNYAWAHCTPRVCHTRTQREFEDLCVSVRQQLAGPTVHHRRAAHVFDLITGAKLLPDQNGPLTLPETVARLAFSKDETTRVTKIIKNAIHRVFNG